MLITLAYKNGLVVRFRSDTIGCTTALTPPWGGNTHTQCCSNSSASFIHSSCPIAAVMGLSLLEAIPAVTGECLDTSWTSVEPQTIQTEYPDMGRTRKLQRKNPGHESNQGPSC